MEGQHLRQWAAHPLGMGFLPHIVHYRRDIDIVGAADRAGETAGTLPHSVRPQDLVLLADGQQMHDLMGQEFHFVGHRAAGGTFAALVTEGWFFFAN